MSERKRTLANAAAGVIALLLAGSAAPAWAAPPAAKKVVAKKVVKKPAKKAVKKTAKKKVAAKPLVAPGSGVVYAPPAPPLPPPVPFPSAPPQPSAHLGFDTAPAATGAYNDASRYRYIDDADSLLDTVGTSPPDYAFTFDGVECWAWELDSGDMVLAEPVGDTYRFYAFAPDGLYPFFVGDDDYSFGFAGRALAAVYDSDTQLVAWSAADAIPNQAAWLAERGRAMKESISVRAPVIASDWASGITFFSDIELRFGDWRSQPGWSRYRIGAGSRHRRDWRARLGKNEGTARRDRADRFDQWRRGGFRGPPPANKGGWNTTPGANRPGRPGSGPRPGGWKGPRPPAPATPGAPPRPRMDRSGKGEPGAPGWPRRSPNTGVTPPPTAQPGAPTPQHDRNNPSRGKWRGNGGKDGATTAPPTTGAPLPPPVYVAPPPGNNPPDRRGGRGGDRPIGSVAPPSSPNVAAPPAPRPAPSDAPARPALGERPARGTRLIDRTAVAPPSPAPMRVAPPPPPPPPAKVAPPPSPSAERPGPTRVIPGRKTDE